MLAIASDHTLLPRLRCVFSVVSSSAFRSSKLGHRCKVFRIKCTSTSESLASMLITRSQVRGLLSPDYLWSTQSANHASLRRSKIIVRSSRTPIQGLLLAGLDGVHDSGRDPVEFFDGFVHLLHMVSSTNQIGVIQLC